jgi:aspartyl aminopeptidase
MVRRLESAGFIPVEELEKEISAGVSTEELAGRKVYVASEDYRDVAGIVIGSKELSEGVNMLFAHLDTPELHVKRAAEGVFDSGDGVFIDTQYYGGIKKHQWFARPLELRGEIAKDGKTYQVQLDLATVPEKLPHLDKQSDQKVGDAFPGEKLDVFTGYFTKDDFYAALSESAGTEISGKDLLNASLTIVPRAEPYRVGDTLVGQHDDTICSYAATKAITDIGTPGRTAIAFAFDKEEIGSNGKTGAQGAFFDYVIDKVSGVVGGAKAREAIDEKGFAAARQEVPYIQDPDAFKREVVMASAGISADVKAAYNPIFPENYDKANGAHAGKGVTIAPYTGRGGKYGASESPIELSERLQDMNEREGIAYQPTLYAQVDGGGGGTIAKFIAQKGASVIDSGPAIWSMHSAEAEVVHADDLYATVREYTAFLEAF